VSCRKVAGPFDMQFGVKTWVGRRNQVSRGGPDSVMGMGNFGGYFPLKCIIMCKQQTSTCTQGTSQCGESEASGWIYPTRV